MANEGKFRVSRATLYNTIILFIDAKLVIKHQFGNSSQYERAYNNETHHHMIPALAGDRRNDRHAVGRKGEAADLLAARKIGRAHV